MEWVWTAVAVWVLIAVPVAVVLGRVIRRADAQELGPSSEEPTSSPPTPKRSGPAH